MVNAKPTIDLDTALAAAGLGAQRERFAPSWPSCGGTQAAADPAFLAPAAVEASGRRIGLSEVQRASLATALTMFAERPALRALAAHLRLLLASGTPLPGEGGWPVIAHDVHPHGPLFWTYIVLACADERIALNRERGIDEASTLAGFRDLGRWMDEYARAHGHLGFDRVGWLDGTVRGTLLEFGRLQCNCSAWTGSQRVFRHRSERRVSMLMIAGVDLRADGRHQGICGQPFDPEGWTSAFSEGPDGWRGSPVDSRGRAQRAEMHLPAAEWEAALAPGDPIWYVHIPASGPLTSEACRDSLLTHRERLPQCFPEHHAKAFISVSWMFDAQLADHLPADANLVRFQRAFHLHPHPDFSGDQIKERVLGRSKMDWRDCVPTSSLQRAVIAHCRAGGTWSQSGAVLFPDEVATAFI